MTRRLRIKWDALEVAFESGGPEHHGVLDTLRESASTAATRRRRRCQPPTEIIHRRWATGPVHGILPDVRHFKIVVERHEEGYVAYPVGLRGVVIGEGDTLEGALADVRSAIQFHVETFGDEAAEEAPVEVLLADLTVPA